MKTKLDDLLHNKIVEATRTHSTSSQEIRDDVLEVVKNVSIEFANFVKIHGRTFGDGEWETPTLDELWERYLKTSVG